MSRVAIAFQNPGLLELKNRTKIVYLEWNVHETNRNPSNFSKVRTEKYWSFTPIATLKCPPRSARLLQKVNRGYVG